MIYLLASLLILALGPLLLYLAERARPAIAFLDGFMVVSVAFLVLTEVLPGSFESAGWWVIPAALVGLLGPTLLERARHRIAGRVHAFALHAAMLGILVHGVFDGVGLASPVDDPHAISGLHVALVLHRFAVGLAIWYLVGAARGGKIAAAYLVGLALTTVVGYAAGKAVLEPVAGGHLGLGLGILQAFIGGALLHVLTHAPDVARGGSPGSGLRVAAAIGAVLALVGGFWMLGGHEHGPGNALVDGAELHGVGAGFLAEFLQFASESAPALLLAYVAAGLLHGFMPAASVSWLRRGGNFSQSLRGVVFGLPLPICSCGVIPLYRSLSTAGVPVAATMSFLVATPELGLDSVFLSFRFFGPELAVARVISVAVVAIAFGAWMGVLSRRLVPGQAATRPPLGTPVPPLGERLRMAWSGFWEHLDSTGPWILFGLALAALAKPLLDKEWISSFDPSLQVPLFALIGIPVYVCAAGATPLMAVFVLQGVSPGAALAFLLTGPATNLTTFGVVSDLHGRRLALIAGLTMAVLAVSCGYVVNLFLPSVELPTREVGHEHGMALSPAIFVLGALFLVSLFRQGPRETIGQILGPGHEAHDPSHCEGDSGEPAAKTSGCH